VKSFTFATPRDSESHSVNHFTAPPFRFWDLASRAAGSRKKEREKRCNISRTGIIESVPEHLLHRIPESWVIRGPGVQTVTQPTKLSDLVAQLAKENPGQQIVVEWAACRGVIDDVTERVAGTIVVMAASGCSDEIAGVGDGMNQTTLVR
jgi:hypothetical protein